MTSFSKFSSRRGLRRALAAGVGMVLLVSTAACGSNEASSAKIDDGKISLRLNWVPGGQHAFLYYGLAQGFFKEEGIELQVEEGKGSQLAIEDVSAGNIDIALAGTAPAILGMGQGRNIVSVATPIGKGTYGFFADKKLGVTSVKELAGKQVLVTPGSPETPLIPAALQAVGLTESDLNLVSVEAASKLNSYVSGRGDAMATTIPFYNAAVQAKRASDTFLFNDLGLILPDYSFLVSRDSLGTNTDLYKKFVRATLKSISAAMDDPEAAATALKEAVPVIDYDLELQSWRDFIPFICSDAQKGQLLGTNSEADYDAAVASLQEFAGLDKSAKGSDFYTNEFFEGDDPVTNVTC